MINQHSLDAVANSKFSKVFTKPLYETYCFSNIIGTVEQILTGKSSKKLPDDILGKLGTDFDTVALIFVDALGWRFIEPRLKTNKVVKKMTSDGVLSKLTSVFPSTTSAALTSMNSGMEPVETEIIEYRQYNEKLNDVIMPIRFKHAYDSKVDLVKDLQLSPSDLYPPKSVYNFLFDHGVASTIFLEDSYAKSEFNKSLFSGSEIYPYLTPVEALYMFSEKINSTKKGKNFIYLYLDLIDEIAHKYGAGSPELDLEIDNILKLIDELVLTKTQGKAGKTLLLITADHGHDVFDPEETIYINKIIPEFESYLRKNSKGEPILPGGSAKDVFLYVDPEHLELAKAKLEETLKGRAEVYLSNDLLEQGFFGTKQPTVRFKKVIGDLVILPYNGQSVWWYRGDKYLKQSKGQHGGLSRNEVEIPLFAYPL